VEALGGADRLREHCCALLPLGERPGHRDELVLRDRDTDGNGSLDERLYATMDYFNGTAILNTSGAVQERYAYSAFGVHRIVAADFSPRSSSSYAWDFGFQGQFRDVETGWSNYGYRFYVPLLGRWINRDPIEERGGVNLYLTTKNQPLNYTDFLGLINLPKLPFPPIPFPPFPDLPFPFPSPLPPFFPPIINPFAPSMPPPLQLWTVHARVL
jgi:RHS repeat-associated protein